MRNWLFLAAINGFLAVAAGAFAVHGLEARLPADAPARAAQWFDTGARYHLAHAVALGLAALVPEGGIWRGRWLAIARAGFLAGIVLFSFSLYALALTGARPWAMVTPFGGLAFLAGWAALAAHALGGERPRAS